MNKAADAFRTISEVADELEVQKHVLRFWENKFPQLHPMKRGGGRRYYRPEDMDLLRGIQHLLRNEGYTIKGVQKILREQGVDEVKRCWQRPGAAKGAAAEGRSAAASRKASASARGEARGRAQSSAAARESATRRAIAAAIRELEVCRRLLNEPPASGASSRASARARQRG